MANMNPTKTKKKNTDNRFEVKETEGLYDFDSDNDENDGANFQTSEERWPTSFEPASLQRQPTSFRFDPTSLQRQTSLTRTSSGATPTLSRTSSGEAPTLSRIPSLSRATSSATTKKQNSKPLDIKLGKITLSTMPGRTLASVQSCLQLKELINLGNVCNSLHKSSQSVIGLPKTQERMRQEIVKNLKYNVVLRKFFESPRVTHLISTGKLRIENEFPLLRVQTIAGFSNDLLTLISLGCSVRDVRTNCMGWNHQRVILQVEQAIRAEVENDFRKSKAKLEVELKLEAEREKTEHTVEIELLSAGSPDPSVLPLDFVPQPNLDPATAAKQATDRKKALEARVANELQMKRKAMESKLDADKMTKLAVKFDEHYQKIMYMRHDILMKPENYLAYAQNYAFQNNTNLANQIATEDKKQQEERMRALGDKKESKDYSDLQKRGLCIGFTVDEVTVRDCSPGLVEPKLKFTEEHYRMARAGFLPKEIAGLKVEQLEYISNGLTREEIPLVSKNFNAWDTRRVPKHQLLDLENHQQIEAIEHGLPFTIARRLNGSFLDDARIDTGKLSEYGGNIYITGPERLAKLYEKTKKEITEKYQGRKYKVDVQKKIEEAFFKEVDTIRISLVKKRGFYSYAYKDTALVEPPSFQRAKEEEKRQAEKEREKYLQRLSEDKTKGFTRQGTLRPKSAATASNSNAMERTASNGMGLTTDDETPSSPSNQNAVTTNTPSVRPMTARAKTMSVTSESKAGNEQSSTQQQPVKKQVEPMLFRGLSSAVTAPRTAETGNADRTPRAAETPRIIGTQNNRVTTTPSRTLTYRAPSASGSNRSSQTAGRNSEARTLPRQASQAQSNPSKKPGCAKLPTADK